MVRTTLSILMGVLIGGLLTANSVFAAQGMGMGAEREVFIPDVDKESFIWQVPTKWYPYSNETDKKLEAYIFPTGQKPKKYKQMLRFEEFKSKMGAVEAKGIHKLRTDAAAAKCTNYSQELEVDRLENGYSTAQWSESCVAEDGSKVFSLTKTIVGNEKLYIATKTWKFEPKESESTKWHDYFRSVYVCDPTTGTNGCEPPRRPGGRGERPGG